MIKMVCKTFCLMFALTISKTASQNMSISSTCITAGTRVTLECETINFASSVLFYLNGVNKGGCTIFSCATTITGYEQPTQSGTTTEMVISAYDHSKDGGDWTCRYGTSTSNSYEVGLGTCVVTTERTREGNALCEGITFIILVVIVLMVCPQSVEVIIVIIIIIKEIQKVKIKVKVDEKKNLQAEQTINNGDRQDISIIKRSTCAIVVQGEDLHSCVFETDAGVLNMVFKIKDDLLNVKHGQTIILPTMLSVDPYYSTIQWTHDEVEFDYDSLCFKTIVNQATYGVYDIKMTFQNLGLTIWIEKMRVQAVRRVWIVIIIFVSFNVPVGVIGGVILVLYRTTDGFCSEENVIIPIVVVFVIGFNLLHVALVYFLMTHFRGKGKNSGFCDNVLCYADVSPCSQEQANDATRTSQTGAVSPAVVPTASTTVVVSSSDVAATTSDDQDRRNWRPLPLPENYTVKKMPLTINEGNDRNLKENAEQINLLDKRL